MRHVVGAGTVSMHREGSGSPLVLVHGLGSHYGVFQPLMAGLSKRHDVLAVDLPGFGRTPPDSSVEPGAPGYAAWLRELLAGLGIVRPHVVGSSLGGGVALELGKVGVASRVTAFSPIGFWRTPGRVWTQALLSSVRLFALYADPLARLMFRHRATRAAALGALFGRPTQIPIEVAIGELGALQQARSFPEARSSFSSYQWEARTDQGHLPAVPVTIAWGTRDITLVHRTQSARARRLLPLARHVDLPGCGHLPFYDDPPLCLQTILEEAP